MCVFVSALVCDIAYDSDPKGIYYRLRHGSMHANPVDRIDEAEAEIDRDRDRDRQTYRDRQTDRNRQTGRDKD